MNSAITDDDALHMPEIICVLKDLAGRLTRLEKRSMAYPATSSLSPSHLPNTAKKSNFPFPTTTTDCRLPKTELGERREGSRQGGEERPASPVPTNAHVCERPNACPHRGPKAPTLHVQPGRAMGVLHPQSQASVTSPTPSAASKTTSGTALLNPPPSRSPSSSTPDPEGPPRVLCTLWIPEVVVGHLIGRVGRGLKLATDISKAHIAVLGPSTEPGAARKATIHRTNEEVGRALVVMGKRITQQRVPNPWRAPSRPNDPQPPPSRRPHPLPCPRQREDPNPRGGTALTTPTPTNLWSSSRRRYGPPHLTSATSIRRCTYGTAKPPGGQATPEHKSVTP
jgi:hypothetical protein